ILHFRGRRTVSKQNSFLPCQLVHTALHGCAQHSHAQQGAYSEAHRYNPIVKHTQHTINLLITQMLTPSCPVPLVHCRCFLLALITVLVSLGMSVTPSQFPPVSECPLQSHN
ncbi:unnamed protein product, partial [Staurois parvus]